MVKNAENLSVDDILGLIKNPTKQEKPVQNKCPLIRKIESLPDTVRSAVEVAIADPNVTNKDLVVFFHDHTDLKVTYNNISDHRNKNGCLVCLYGGSR